VLISRIFYAAEGVTTDNEIVLVGPDGEKYTRMIVRNPFVYVFSLAKYLMHVLHPLALV
jgi:hypothetical protein